MAAKRHRVASPTFDRPNPFSAFQQRLEADSSEMPVPFDDDEFASAQPDNHARLAELERQLQDDGSPMRQNALSALPLAAKEEWSEQPAPASATTAPIPTPLVVGHDYSKRPETGGYKIATTFLAQELYLPFNRFKTIEKKIEKRLNRTARAQLLATSVYRLLDDIEAETRLTNGSHKLLLPFINGSALMGIEATYHIHQPNSDLWVDRYRPKSYIDLLSDEWLNKEVSLWIKQWEQCVFGKTTGKTKYRNKGSFRSEEILLLTGPPGYGKTTMVHILARQLGYHAFEVNASDERSGDTLKDRIVHAIESQAVLGSKRPNLVVLDEIDGALGGQNDGSLIKFLVDLVSNDSNRQGKKKSFDDDENANDENDVPQMKKRKGGKTTAKRNLMRPIICICNDLYTPALRPLRAVAQVYHFRKPSVSLLSKRLKHICDVEGLKIETRALSLLCEKTDCDIRTALNTLQFLHHQQKHMYGDSSSSKKPVPKTVTMSMIQNLNVGLKDMQKSIFTVWQHIFTEPSTRQRDLHRKLNNSTATSIDNSTSFKYHVLMLAAFIERIMGAVQANGEYDRILQGCFEFYPAMQFRELHGFGSNMTQLHDFIYFSDRVSQLLYTTGRGLTGYLPYGLLAFHRYCAQASTLKLEFPRQDSDWRAVKRKHDQTVRSVMMHLDAGTRQLVSSGTIFCTEILTPLLRILSPALRPLNPQLLKPNERAALAQLVRVMASFKLTYLQEKTETGNYIYQLEPPIDSLVQLPDLQGVKNLLPAMYTVRQMIANEISTESMRREEQLAARRMQQNAAVNERKSAPVIVKQPLEPVPVKIQAKELVAKDFFGRPIVQADGDDAEPAAKPARVWYKFFEGYSNAVRRNLSIAEIAFPQ